MRNVGATVLLAAMMVVGVVGCGDDSRTAGTTRTTGTEQKADASARDRQAPAAPTPTPNPRLDISIPHHDGPPPTPAPKATGTKGSAATKGEAKAEYRFVLEAPARVASMSKPLSIKLSYTNTSTADLFYQLTSSQSWDLAIDDIKGERVWLWSADKAFMMAMQGVMVRPGQTIGDTLEIDLPALGLAPGEYVLVGSLGGGFAVTSEPLAIRLER